MKKIYSLFLFSIIILNCYSQELSTSKSNFKGGVRLGMTATQISGDDLSGYNKIGAYAGGYTNFPITKDGKLKFQFELNFIMKGSSTNFSGQKNPDLSRKYVLTLLYTETPLLFKYNIYKGFEIEAGPAVNFLFATVENGAEGGLGRPPFNFYEIAFVIGANYLFKEHWGISFRWSTSVIPVRIPSWVINERVKKQYNDVLAFSLYYQF